jgi:hypothetical protein
VSAPNKTVVSRTYKPAPDECARALELLLKKSVSKKAAEPAPELDSHDDAKESNGCIAYSNHNR